jgi:hypothetical protein
MKPALLIVDIHTGWDSDVAALLGGEKSVESQLIEREGRLHSLRTEATPDAALVKRGIYQKPLNGACEEGYLVPTIQVKKRSEALFGSSHKIRGLEPEDDDRGELLDACDYVLAARVRHDSGWGPMTACVLIAVDPTAKLLNKAWSDTLRQFVRKLFVEDSYSEDVRAIRALLDFFNEPSPHGAQRDRKNGDLAADQRAAGHRELAIIMPFDPVLTFAKFTGLFSDSDDEEIFRYSLLLEPPNRAQHRFPTAYSLYHTLLDIVSSSQGFTHEWAPTYHRTRVGEEFDKLEKRLLKLDLAGPDFEADFSIVPLYYASLPLFCLILKFPDAFPEGSTSADVYQSVLRNLHDQIKLAVIRRFKEEILRPFVDRFIAESIALERIRGQVNLTDLYVQQIERYLFGETQAESDSCGSRTFGALHKPWKSWILTIPSQNIATLQSVKAETATLDEHWRGERKRALSDDALRLADWFQVGGFFSGEVHEYWSCALHPRALANMCYLAGCRNDTADRDDETVLSDAVSWLGSLKNNGNVYFGPSCTGFLFEWMVYQFRELLALKENCEAGSTSACRPRNRGACARNVVFDRLKAVFYKMQGGRGPGVRFGLERLHCLLVAASRDFKSMRPACHALQSLDLEQTCWSPLDPSIAIAMCVDDLYHFGFEPKCMLRPGPSEGGVEILLSINLTRKLLSRKGGDDCGGIIEAFEGLRSLGSASIDPIFDTESIDIRFVVSPAPDQGIVFRAT